MGTAVLPVKVYRDCGLKQQAGLALIFATLVWAGSSSVAAAGAFVTNTFSFTYTNREALLADGWSFIATMPPGPSETPRLQILPPRRFRMTKRPTRGCCAFLPTAAICGQP